MSKAQAKQAIFVREYMIHRNGTKAAIAAGYAPRSASVTSCRLLRNAKVQSTVAELTDERLDRLEITADTVLQELAKIAFANMKDYLAVETDGSISVDVSQISPNQASALADLRIDVFVSEKGRIRRRRVRLASKTRALELLGKHLKLWADRTEAKHEHMEGLADRIKKARERVVRGMSEEELEAKIKELQMQLESRHLNTLYEAGTRL